VEMSHVLKVASLPNHHRDPFANRSKSNSADPAGYR
jgi:PIN domain nuclease of toxin-antitoxin system